jgi:branched-chain amino acid transport system substrate-binding protein
MLARIFIAGLVAAFVPAFQAFAQTPGVTDTEIKIGVHLSLTGPASFVGQGSRVGIQLAQAEINAAGGVNGRKLNFVFVDDRGTPDGGVAAARRLVDEEKVFFVLGAGTSTSTVPVLPFFERNATVPYYVSLASDPRVLEKFRPNVYSGATSTQDVFTEVMAKFVLQKLKPKRVTLVQCDQGHCTSGGPRVKANLEKGGVTVTVVTFNSGDTDFTGQVQQIKASNPDVVFVYGLASDGGRLFPQIRRAGITAQIVADTSLADPSVAAVAGPAAEGFNAFWIGGTQFIDDKTGEMAKWLASLDKYNIERPANTPNLYSLMMYADVYVVAEAMRTAGKDLTRENFIKSLDANIKNFVAGKDGYWKNAEAIGNPRTFTSTDHLGNRTLQPLVSQGGVFKPVSM